MGKDVSQGAFSREDRARYRQKVRRCLDVFALMLDDFGFDAERPTTGLEIELNLVDSVWGVILPQIAFGLPGNILILRGFFITIPQELEEAAAIDGCSPAGFFVRVLLPLMRPALAAVVVLTMVGSWNGFFLPLLVLNSEQLWTLPLGIMQFQGQFGTDWARVLAFVSIALMPTIIFYLLAERQIIAGLTAGAVKG